jgi:NAD-dependent aldehyde dehydrogenases
MLKSINPANNKSIKTYDEMTINQIEKIISSAQKEYEIWKTTTFETRAKLMFNAASVLRKNVKEYSELMTEEMGKPIAQARAEVEKCAWVCDYYAENAENFLKDELVKTDASESFITYQPIGIVLAIMPWNFPFLQVFRFAAPNLMAGNVGILKHASNVSSCALAIEDVLNKQDFRKIFYINSSLIKNVKEVISNEMVKAVTLTGSVPAGKSVASLAGSLIKKQFWNLAVVIHILF